MTTLKRAESKLKRAEDRLPKSIDSVSGNQCCSQLRWVYAKVCLTLFPENVKEIFNDVDQDLASIPDILQKEEELSNRVREASKNQAISTTIRDNDSKYVPIAKSQEEVIKAIEDSHGPLMILLYGGFGKGKSTLARYICHRYGKIGEKSNLFEHVIFVSCGNSSVADLSTKQYEILELLSPRSLIEQDSKSGSGKSNIESGSKSRIEKALEKFLIRKKVLIILDDVRDASFLYEMWEVAKDGKDDKILITSQKFNLCDNLKGDSKVIQMETPTLVEARKILASLVGLERKEIPADLQAIADDMINATDRNPLALACLAGSFAYNQNKKSKREWQDVWRELSKQLDNKEMAIVLGRNDEIPSRSLYKTVKSCIDSLDTKYHAICILFLMYAFKGESVPEEVLRILWAGMGMPSSTTFNRARGELCMRELLKPTGHSLASKIFGNLEQNDDELLEARAWSLHSVVKLYMQETQIVGKEEIRGTIGALLGDEDFPPQSNIEYEQDNGTEIVEVGTSKEMTDEMRVVIGLCALYFDHGHTDQVVTHAVTRATKICGLEVSDNTINDLRRIVIEPMIWLLDKPEEPKEQWTKSNSCRVRKVVLKYIYKRQLDNENISYLLKFAACPSAQLATLMSLARISTTEEGPLLNENTISVLKVVVDLLIKEGHHTTVQEAASQALISICWKVSRDRSTSLLRNLSAGLDVLVPSLATLLSKSDAFTENAAYAVASLVSGSRDRDTARTILNEHGLLAGLVRCLHEKDKQGMQEAAAQALVNLVSGLIEGANESLLWKIANEDGALVGLVNCLSNHGKADSQVPLAAAAALANLASSAELKLRIANEEGALVKLVKCLSNEDNPALQFIAGMALGNLDFSEELNLRIANQEGALTALVNCLSKEDKPDLQAMAVRALAYLAASPQEVSLGIAKQEGALAGLVNCLSKQDKPDLLEKAARALANLAGSDSEEVRLRIANQEGALVGLVNCLSKEDKPNLQEVAVGALANLAASSQEVRLGIAKQEGALVGLVNCLSKHHMPVLLEMAAAALANLAVSSEEVRLGIANQEGALVGLVNCLSKDDKPDLLEAAARALASVAGSDSEEVKLGIAKQEGALVGLVNCLSKDDNLDLLKVAPTALGNLARSDCEELRFWISNREGALVRLVNCLSKDDKPDLLEAAARALANLAGSDSEEVSLGIAKQEGALIGLVNCLSKDDNPDLLKAAATALGNLARSDCEELRLRISNREGALVGLVNCLSKDDNPDLLRAAATALGNLAKSDSKEVKLGIANQEGAIGGLVKCLLMDDKVDVLEAAAKALANLAVSSEEVRLGIAKQERALVGLVNGLSMHEKPDLVKAAATALANLAGSNSQEVRLRIANQEGALVGLVNCLSNDDKPDLLEEAARALANLAGSDPEEVRLGIAKQEGAVVGLVNCLSKDDKPDLLKMAAAALANLAVSSEEVRLGIAKQERALVGLVNCLSKDDKPDLLKVAATALGNLARSDSEELRLRISKTEGALVRLVNCLSKDDKPDVLEAAARALANLAGSGSEEVRLGIAKQEGALVGLVSCLSKGDNPDLLKAASRALGNLSASSEELRLRICNLVREHYSGS